jgi:hypothetical protein
MLSTPRFFKPLQAKQFDYMPRYYDPAKEAREKRFKELREEMNAEQFEQTKRKIDFREQSKLTEHRGFLETARKRNMRLLIIMSILGMIAWYLFENLDKIIK